MRILIILLAMLIVMPAHSADTCDAGYYLNDAGECEICPAGYYCDGETMQVCPFNRYCFYSYEEFELILPIGAKNETECFDTASIAPGYYLFIPFRMEGMIVECQENHYCPGIKFSDIEIISCNNSTEFGIYECPAGTYNDNTGSANSADCLVCPNTCECPNAGEFDCSKSYGELICEESLSTAFSQGCNCDLSLCMVQRIFVSSEVEKNPVLMQSVLEGEGAEISSGFASDKHHGMYLTLNTYDSDAGQYSTMGFVLGCDGGYYSPYAMEYYGIYLIGLENMESIINNACVPVETGYYSPNWIVDENMNFVEMGLERNACPEGTFSSGYGTGADGVEDCVAGCPAGTLKYDKECVKGCSAGISKLNVGGGVSLPLFADRITSPSLNVMYNNQVCYIPLTKGKGQNTVHVMSPDGTVYHVE